MLSDTFTQWQNESRTTLQAELENLERQATKIRAVLSVLDTLHDDEGGISIPAVPRSGVVPRPGRQGRQPEQGQLRIIDAVEAAIVQEGAVSNQDVRDRLRARGMVTTYANVATAIKRLSERGKVRMRGKGRGRRLSPAA